jgi:hypothetical protein
MSAEPIPSVNMKLLESYVSLFCDLSPLGCCLQSAIGWIFYFSPQLPLMTPINQNWTDDEGNHQGGVSTGIGYTISWQRGPLNVAGRNGAFLIEVLSSCRDQLAYFQDSSFVCEENQAALDRLDQSIAHLVSRRDRRKEVGTLGTHKKD